MKGRQKETTGWCRHAWLHDLHFTLHNPHKRISCDTKASWFLKICGRNCTFPHSVSSFRGARLRFNTMPRNEHLKTPVILHASGGWSLLPKMTGDSPPVIVRRRAWTYFRMRPKIIPPILSMALNKVKCGTHSSRQSVVAVVDANVEFDVPQVQQFLQYSAPPLTIQANQSIITYSCCCCRVGATGTSRLPVVDGFIAYSKQWLVVLWYLCSCALVHLCMPYRIIAIHIGIVVGDVSIKTDMVENAEVAGEWFS